MSSQDSSLKNMAFIEIYTDGSAKGNPNGPGGYGVLLRYKDPDGRVHERHLSAGYRRTTNNRMELMAAIASLECLNRPCRVKLYSDSSYLSNAFNKWVKGHAGHPENEFCDKLATDAAGWPAEKLLDDKQ